MSDVASSLEALRLISDWAKWLITIETGAIAVIGATVSAKSKSGEKPSKSVMTLATGAVASFTVSIAAAAVLLLSLPEIAQSVRPETNIWLTSDSVLGKLFGLNTQTLASFESVFFGVGILSFAAMILVAMWSPLSDRTLIGRRELQHVDVSQDQQDTHSGTKRHARSAEGRK